MPMGKKNEVLDAIQHLGRSIKRRGAKLNPASHGRAQGKTLRFIADNDGIKASQLADMLDIRPASLTQKLDRLEADGNIRRVRDINDARVVRLHITKEGLGAIERRELEKEKLTEDFSDCLSDAERKLFCEFCNRLSNNIERIEKIERVARARGGVVSLRKEKDPEFETDIDYTENQSS